MAISKRVGKDAKTTRWQVTIDTPDALSGKRKRTVVGTFRTEKEADAAERNAMIERERGTLVKRDKTSVAGLLDKWLEVEAPCTVRPENIQNYEIVIRKHLKPALGDYPAQKLTVEAVERFYASMQEAGYSSSMIKKCHMCLASALRMAKRWKLVSENVCDDVRPPKTSYGTPEV